MEVACTTDGKMQEISTVWWNGGRFNRRKHILSIAIIILLLLSVSMFLAIILTRTKNVIGDDDAIQTGGRVSNESANPESTAKVDLESTSVFPEPTHKTNIEDDFKGDFKPLDCYDLLTNGNNVSGVYDIYPSGNQTPVYCDQETDGGGWTVFQRRCDGSENFFRGWYDYQMGFGHLTGEFWLGNDALGRLTNQRDYILRIDLEDFENETRYAQYNYFRVRDHSTNYTLTIGGYEGTAGDSLSFQNGMQFSTKDRDNDRDPRDCAVVFKGAWWYNARHHSNLNGRYYTGHHESYGDGINWRTWKDFNYALKKTEMKCRPMYL